MIVITLKVDDRVQNNDRHMNTFSSCNRHRGTIIKIHANELCEVKLDKEIGVPEGYVWKLHSDWLEKIGDNMQNYKEYNFPGNIKATIDENHGVWKLDFDSGNVDFKVWRTPRDYGGSTRTETYLGIPVINFDGDSGWWINLSDLDGEHNINKGELKQFPLYTTKEYCDKFIKAVEVIVNKFIEVGYIKQEKEEENMFNGLNTNVESVIYDFDGCTVKVSRTDVEDKFAININPGNWNFDSFNSKEKYELETSTQGGYGWWIHENRFGSYFNNGNNHFNNGDKFTIEDINKILLNVKGGVEFRKRNKNKVKLMTREEMLELLDKSELLPSEICKKKYEMFKEYCIVNNVCSVDEVEEITDEDAIESSTCALCEVYHNSDSCNNCPLKMVDHHCGMDESSYRKLCDYDDDYEEFIECIDNMIETLDKAIEYEKKITHIFTESEMKALCAEGKMTAAEISLEIWKQKEAYVKTHKNCVSHSILLKLNDDVAGNCALCYVQKRCSTCPLAMVGSRCNNGSSYDNVICYIGGNHEEFLKRVHEMVLTLEKTVEYEKKEKCKNKDLVEIPNGLCVFDCSDVNIITRPYSDGLFKISIDSNGYDLALLQAESVEFANDHEFVYFWKSLGGDYDWLLISDIIYAMLNEKDKSKFNNAHFNNGINLSKEGTQILVSILKKYFEAAAKNGNLKRK